MSKNIDKLLKDYTMPPANFRWGHCYIVRADGGARSDFIACWLTEASISHPIRTPWVISVRGGRTCMHQGGNIFEQALFDDTQDVEFINWLSSVHHESAPVIVQKTHKSAEYLPIPVELIPYTTVINVTIDFDDLITIVWEFTSKTFLSGVFDIDLLRWFRSDQDLEQIATDHDKVHLIEKMIQHQITVLSTTINTPPPRLDDSLNIVNVRYKDIVSPQGSHVIADCLNLEISPRDHELWARGLAMASAPTEIIALGKTWRKTDIEQECKNIITAMFPHKFS